MKIRRQYTALENRIMLIIRSRLLSEFKSRGIMVTGGIHIKPKPKQIRVDVIELNTIGISENRITKSIWGLANINYQDESCHKAEIMAKLISDLLDSSVDGNIFFQLSSPDRVYEIFRNGPNLWIGNVSLILKHKNS